MFKNIEGLQNLLRLAICYQQGSRGVLSSNYSGITLPAVSASLIFPRNMDIIAIHPR